MARGRFLMMVGSLIGLLALAACGQVSLAAPEEQPAKVEPIGDSGISRITLAERAAERASMPSNCWSLAKTTSRILLAVATPMHMIDPISDGTLKVVCVR